MDRHYMLHWTLHLVFWCTQLLVLRITNISSARIGANQTRYTLKEIKFVCMRKLRGFGSTLFLLLVYEQRRVFICPHLTSPISGFVSRASNGICDNFKATEQASRRSQSEYCAQVTWKNDPRRIYWSQRKPRARCVFSNKSYFCL